MRLPGPEFSRRPPSPASLPGSLVGGSLVPGWAACVSRLRAKLAAGSAWQAARRSGKGCLQTAGDSFPAETLLVKHKKGAVPTAAPHRQSRGRGPSQPSWASTWAPGETWGSESPCWGTPGWAARQGTVESEQTLQLPGRAVSTLHRGSHHTARWVGECPRCPAGRGPRGFSLPKCSSPCVCVCVCPAVEWPQILGAAWDSRSLSEHQSHRCRRDGAPHESSWAAPRGGRSGLGCGGRGAEEEGEALWAEAGHPCWA